MTFNNGLSLAQAELLTVLTEELAESIKEIQKIQRHGYESTHPDGGPTNRENLERELGDVRVLVILLLQTGDISDDRMTEFARRKMRRIGRYLHHSTVDFDESEQSNR